MGDETNEGGAELSGMVDAVGVAHRGDVLQRLLEPELDDGEQGSRAGVVVADEDTRDWVAADASTAGGLGDEVGVGEVRRPGDVSGGGGEISGRRVHERFGGRGVDVAHLVAQAAFGGEGGEDGRQGVLNGGDGGAVAVEVVRRSRHLHVWVEALRG